MLGIDELYEISAIVQEALNDRLDEILSKLNRTGQLEEFLSLIGMSELIGTIKKTSHNKEGIIIVVGKSDVPKEKLAGVAKSLGFGKDRFEFNLDYEDGKTYNFKKAQYSDAYSAILVGEMPHSGKAKEDYSSTIAALEGSEGYPPVVRVGMKNLKITKASFRESLEYLLNEGIVA